MKKTTYNNKWNDNLNKDKKKNWNKWNNNGDQQLENETTIMYHINKRMNNNNWNNKRTNGTSQ